MPWCETCSRYLTPSSLADDGTCPTCGRQVGETDQAEISSRFYNVLNSVAQVLDEYEKTIVDITGHTDSTGEESYNLNLSQRRATNVAQYLIAQGVNSTRIAAQGMGESQPIASNDTPEGRQANRRVEIELSPLTQPG